MRTADRLRGTSEYYFSRKLDEVRKLRARGVDVINLGIGSPDLAPSEETIEAAQKGIRNEGNHGYSSYRSSPELRAAIARWYRKLYGVALDSEREVLPLLGSKEGIFYASMAFLNPGDAALVPNPGYPAYASATRLAGGRVETYDLTEENGWLPDLEELARRRIESCKIMWVNYPHMPTGKKANPGFFRDLVQFARSAKILICHDNPYGLVLNTEPPMSVLSFDPEKSACLELNSFSKAFNMAGWRVGALCASEEVVNAVLQVKSNVDSGMFAPIQLGAIAALGNSDEWHDDRNEVYRRRRGIVQGIFDQLGFKYDREQVGLFIWAKAPDGIGKVDVFLDEMLHDARVFMVPGAVFGSNGDRYARSSLCASEALLAEALSRVTRWVGQRSGGSK